LLNEEIQVLQICKQIAQYIERNIIFGKKIPQSFATQKLFAKDKTAKFRKVKNNNMPIF